MLSASSCLIILVCDSERARFTDYDVYPKLSAMNHSKQKYKKADILVIILFSHYVTAPLLSPLGGSAKGETSFVPPQSPKGG